MNSQVKGHKLREKNGHGKFTVTYIKRKNNCTKIKIIIKGIFVDI